MSDEAKPPRDEKGRFPPGVSGNTRGRSTDRARFEKRLRLLGIDSERLLKKTVKAALRLKGSDRDEGATALRAQGLKAATFVLEQRYGKAKQAMEHTGANGANLSLLTTRELIELARPAFANAGQEPADEADQAAGSVVQVPGADQG